MFSLSNPFFDHLSITVILISPNGRQGPLEFIDGQQEWPPIKSLPVPDQDAAPSA
jgi:hypothetical protein